MKVNSSEKLRKPVDYSKVPDHIFDKEWIEVILSMGIIRVGLENIAKGIETTIAKESL